MIERFWPADFDHLNNSMREELRRLRRDFQYEPHVARAYMRKRFRM